MLCPCWGMQNVQKIYHMSPKQSSCVLLLSRGVMLSVCQVAVVRLMQQLSQVYSLMTIPALQALVPFMSFAEVCRFMAANGHKDLFVHAVLCVACANKMQCALSANCHR